MAIYGLLRCWRRKPTTVFGLLLFVGLFILSVHFIATPSTTAPTSISSSKRMVQQSQNFFYAEKAEGKMPDPDVFDAKNRGVNFVSGQSNKVRDKVESVIQQDELDYYKRKNKILYQAQADAMKRKNELLKKLPMSHQAYQPYVSDDNEYDNNHMNNIPLAPPNKNFDGVPIYRGDLGNNGVSPQQEKDETPYIPRKRLIHLDLKGAPPKVDYILKVLQLAKNLSATGVLMEYEDMFPYEGKLSKVVAENHYSKKDIQTILNKCEELQLEVIPLVQTFGHLEFVLKHPEFAHLRDRAEMPESICPCHPEAMDLIKELIDQTMALHPKANYLHIGCDEVFHLGECEPCLGKSRTEVFVDHVLAVSKYVKFKHRHLGKSIVWDDMLRNFLSTELRPLGDLVTPMIWVYAENVDYYMPYWTFKTFSEVFSSAWTASAFKGAHGPALTVPDVGRHLTNNLNWLSVMKSEDPKFVDGFDGIVLTGWQRYDHFATLCEILPVGIPSMAVDLLATRDGFFNTSNIGDVMKALECVGTHRNLEAPLDFESDPYLFDKMSWCFFPGSTVFKMVAKLNRTEENIRAFFREVDSKAWLNDFSIRNNFSTPFRIDEIMNEWPLHYRSLVDLMHSANQVLSEVFDESVVSEWIELKMYPLLKQLTDLKKAADRLANAESVWPKRPLKVSKEVQDAFKEIGLFPGQTSLKPSSSSSSSPSYQQNNFGQGYSEVVRYNGNNNNNVNLDMPKILNNPIKSNNEVLDDNFEGPPPLLKRNNLNVQPTVSPKKLKSL